MKLVTTLLATVLLISACGRNQILDTQESARNDMKETLLGTWTTPPEGGQKRSIAITKDTISFEVSTCRTPECTSLIHTVAHGGTYVLAHNYKTGVNNSIIFTPSNELAVTLHDAQEVKRQNNHLIVIRGKNETPYGETETDETVIEEAKRNNAKLRATKELKDWAVGQPKVLTRFQLEFLSTTEYGILVKPVAEQGTRVNIRYELDNGYLQIGSAVSRERQVDSYGRLQKGGYDQFDLNGVFSK